MNSSLYPDAIEIADQFVQSYDGSLRLFVRRYGSSEATSPPVVCLHGLTRNSLDFEELARHLARKGHSVFAFDQRGRGRSDWDADASNYQPMIYCQDMFSAFARLGVERPVIVGTSMGGIMAMIMAATNPIGVSALVLNDVGPEVSIEGLERIRGYVGQSEPVSGWDAAAKATRANNAVALPDYDHNQWIAFARRTYQPRGDGMLVPAYDPAIAGGLAPAEPSAVPPDLWVLWAGLADVPILAIRGAHSDILSEATLTRMGATHPGMKAAIMPNRGHAPMLDEPEALSAIDQFLESLAL